PKEAAGFVRFLRAVSGQTLTCLTTRFPFPLQPTGRVEAVARARFTMRVPMCGFELKFSRHVMRRQLVLVAVCGACAFLGGVTSEAFFTNAGSVSAQPGSPLPPVPDQGGAERHAPHERFQPVIKQLSPSVVAVDAVKPPEPGAPKKELEE